MSRRKTVFVGMSGGVDSSVAAYLLKEQGHDVVGVFMRCYNVDGCAERDAEDARRVAEKIGIPFYTWDFEEEYKRRVVEYMVEGYRAGLTPNPDVMCNREIKFGLFMEKALTMGADLVATGHYVRKESRIENRESSRKTKLDSLWIAKDTNKDQSYFLWTLTPQQIQHSVFPIGDLLKPEVRAIAKKAGLPTAEKKDSQGICFLGQVTLADFLSTYLPHRTGKLVTPEGGVVGEHRGAQFYTVGQRHVGSSIAVRGRKGDLRPHYVVAKDVRTNTVTVAEGSDNPLLFKTEVVLDQVNVLRAPARKPGPAKVLARVRYRQALAPATLHPDGRLVFDAPQQFVAEGQSAVWYSAQGEMLGGGVIVDSH